MSGIKQWLSDPQPKLFGSMLKIAALINAELFVVRAVSLGVLIISFLWFSWGLILLGPIYFLALLFINRNGQLVMIDPEVDLKSFTSGFKQLRFFKLFLVVAILAGIFLAVVATVDAVGSEEREEKKILALGAGAVLTVSAIGAVLTYRKGDAQ